MLAQAAVTILFRWLHIIAAAMVIGGVFFLRFILPAAVASLDPQARQEVLTRCRRAFKMLVHTCILLLLASGTYNAIMNWPQYNARPGLLQGLWGTHVLLALLVFGIAIWLLSGSQPRASHRMWITVNLVLLLALVAVASTLKWGRETAHQPAPAAAPARG